jgi:polysaccharide deacetylase family protein (PEP-CTERM system associated)
MMLDAHPKQDRTIRDVAAAPGKPVGDRAVIRNAMTVDVEDYFQVQAFASTIDRASWDNWPRRVEANTERVLGLFSEHSVKATFFTLGWVAQRHRSLIRRIVDEGHELASHGMAHFPVFDQTPDQFRADVRQTKQLLEDIGGVPVKGYRAASFSITKATLWALPILAEEGYAYSSSIYPVVHDFYGMPDAPRFAFKPQPQGLTEIPLTTVLLFGRNFPCSGGGYFRLLPYALSHWAFRRVNARDQKPGIFYFHPWEVDPDQPRPPGLPLKSRLRHYVNLKRMEPRLRHLLGDFAWTRMDQLFLASNA